MYSEEFVTEIVNTIEEHFNSKLKEAKDKEIGTMSQHAALNLLKSNVDYQINRIRKELYKIEGE